MRTSLVLSVIAGLLTVAPGGRMEAQEPPQRSVFALVVMEHAIHGPYQSAYHGFAYGTGFFIAADGTAITSSHIVYPVRTNPITYQLLAIVGREFYGATLICSSDLPYDPIKQDSGFPLSRDVAEIRLTPPHFPFDQLGYGNTLYVSAHHGPFPQFPALTLAADPEFGDDVRILGFGYVKEAPLPYEWSASGTVWRMRVLEDGTRAFEVSMTRAAEPGHSGSPVLNTSDQVVGLWNWGSRSDPTRGTAVSSSALNPVCR